MLPTLIEIAGLVLASALLVLPGAWIVLARPLEGVSRLVLLATACALSPLVLFAQFYVLRIAGADFATTAWTVGIANVPALELVRRRLLAAPRQPVRFSGTIVLLHALAFVALALPAMFQADHRAWLAHSWLRSASIYFLASGQLAPEESQLAGVVTSYPWGGHVYQGLVSFLADAPPATSYLWTNLLWLAGVSVFVCALVGRIGGRANAKVAALIALWFGVDAVRFAMREWLPSEPVDGPAFEDMRYAPWLWKYRLFQQTTIGIGLMAALAYWLARAWEPRRPARAEWTVLAALVLALGVLCPILLPPVVVVVAAIAALALLPIARRALRIDRRRAFAVAATLAASSLLACAHFAWVTSDRAEGDGGFSNWGHVVLKCFEACVVTSPLLVAAAVAVWRRFPSAPREVAVLALFGLGSLALYALLDVPSQPIESKFVFVAAFGLAPLAGVALEPWLDRARAVAPAVAVFAALFLATPFVRRVAQAWSTPDGPLPRLDVGRFELALDPSEVYAPICAALRETPHDTMLLADAAPLDLPALVKRSMYAPAVHLGPWHPGLRIEAPYLLRSVRAYDTQLIERRFRERDDVYRGDDRDREAALRSALALGRPLAIVFDRRRHEELAAWLEANPLASRLAASGPLEAWLAQGLPELADVSTDPGHDLR